jgi:microcystin degradation protein MlrC
MARIAIGGIQHETNTFAPRPAGLQEFESADAWPGLTRGAGLFDAVAGINLPIAGFIAEARSLGHELVPLSWCSAQPSGRVTRHAFETVSAMLLDELRAARNLDAVYLDLHGAMVTEHLDDGDGELLRRVHAMIGDEVPLVASLDFHANVSPLMARSAHALVSYRTYPHVDMAEAGARAARCLHDLLGRSRPVAALGQLDFLIALTSQSTLVEPLSSLMAEAVARERSPLLSVGLAPGFPAADVPDCGPSVYACGWEGDRVCEVVAELEDMVRAREPEFALDLYSIDRSLQEITRSRPVRGRPLILADTQDNPGAGGNADTTSLLKALAAAHVDRVLAGVIWDPDTASRAHEAGVGATIEASVGAHSDFEGETPFVARFVVEALGDGRFTGTGPFYRGARFELGPMALLRLGGLQIAVASRKQQAADRAMFRHLGVDPEDFAVLALKSSVHFRADFAAIASRILVVEAPGPNVADPAKLPFANLRRGMRLRPRS